MTSNNFKIEKNLKRVGVRHGVVKRRSQTAQSNSAVKMTQDLLGMTKNNDLM